MMLRFFKIPSLEVWLVTLLAQAFPAGSGPTDRTTYLFTYVAAQPGDQKLEELLEDNWDLLPSYQGVVLDKLEIQRVVIGIFPTHRDSEVIEEYDRLMKELAVRLTRLMLLALDLEEHDMQCANFGEAATKTNLMGAIRLNSYPPCPDPGRTMGMAAHSDSSLLTILYQNGVSGLQVLQSETQFGSACWAPVPASRGTLVVILGDLFQILSNGRFKSAFHRAVVNRTERRISSAYFFGPTTAEVTPAARLVSCNQGPRYRAVTWPEYRGIKAKLFQGALDSLKIN